jgi:hypothetical protein
MRPGTSGRDPPFGAAPQNPPTANTFAARPRCPVTAQGRFGCLRNLPRAPRATRLTHWTIAEDHRKSKTKPYILEVEWEDT